MSSLTAVYLGAGGVNPSPGGTEVSGSRRLVYLADSGLARVSYGGGGLGDAQVGIMASLDMGATWAEFVPYGPPLSSGTVLSGEWTDVSAWAPTGDVLVSAWVRGAALSLGLLYQLSFIDLQVR